MAGLDARETVRNGKPSITVKERGPLVASFVVTSDAPGCNSLTREDPHGQRGANGWT